MDVPIIAPSALKYGIDERDIRHAYRNPVRIWDLGDGFAMMVGSTGTAVVIEVGYVESERVHVIVHAMRARGKFRR